MFWEKKLAQWADEVRAKANIPARLVLWNGDQLDFGTFSAPQVTLKVNSASALPLLLEPSLDNLGEAYVKGKIDIEGRLSDIINISYSLARSTVTSASKLARVMRQATGAVPRTIRGDRCYVNYDDIPGVRLREACWNEPDEFTTSVQCENTSKGSHTYTAGIYVTLSMVPLDYQTEGEILESTPDLL